MKTVIFQVSAIGFLISILVLLGFYLREGDKEERTGKDLWMIRGMRTAPVVLGMVRCLLFFHKEQDEAELPEGSFYLGSDMILDDIVLNTNAGIRLYLNVERDKVLLTVLKGQVQINGYTYRKDSSRQVIIRDHMEVFTNEAKLIFRRKQVR